MRRIGIFALAALAATLSAPAFAQDEDKLACMDSGYSDEDQATFDNFTSNFDLNSLGTERDIAMVLGKRAYECAGTEEPSEDMLVNLIQYRFAGLSLDGIRASRPDAAAAVDRLNSELPTIDRDRMYELFQVSVFGDPSTGITRELTVEEDEFFNDTLINPPVGATMEQAEMIGAYMAAELMQAQSAAQLKEL